MSQAFTLSGSEKADLEKLSEYLDRISKGEIRFEDILEFLKRNAPPPTQLTPSEQKLFEIVLRQRLKQLVQKYIASASIKRERTEHLRQTLAELEAQRQSAQLLTKEKQRAIEDINRVQGELEDAVSKAQAAIVSEAANANTVIANAQAQVQDRQLAVAQAKRKLEAVISSAEEHQKALEHQQQLLESIRKEIPLKEELAEHEALMASLEGELAQDMSQAQQELESMKRHLEETTEKQINDRVEELFGADLKEVARQEQEIEQRLYAEALAVKAAREQLAVLKLKSENKDHDMDAAIHAFDKQVNAIVAPLREEIENIREEIFRVRVHGARKTELEAELAELEKELALLMKETEARRLEMSETQAEFDSMIKQVRDEKTLKLEHVTERFNQFKAEVRDKEVVINLGLEEQRGIEKQAELKRQQVENMYERIDRLEAGLRLRSAEMELLQREIANTNDSARVHTEEVFMAESVQKMADKESSIKKELKQCLDEKLAIVKELRANVESQQVTVKDHAQSSDAGKRALEKIRDVDDKRLKLLNSELAMRTDQIAGLKKLLKNLRDEVTALEKVKGSCERYKREGENHLEHLDEQLKWFSQHADSLKGKQITKENSVIPRMQYAVRATDQRLRDIRAIAYVVEDRTKATAWHSEVIGSRKMLLESSLQSLELERQTATDKVALVRAEIANVEAEIQVEEARISILQKDISAQKDRSRLLEKASNNADNEMRLHKIASSVWQSKIKVVRDEMKVREMRLRVLEDDILRLEDLKKVRTQTLDLTTSLRDNIGRAVAITQDELVCLETQKQVFQKKTALSG
eukprot:c20297_g1_i1.p1 GENE.c20297_g1_i1~~c20297_g1_i1.p1  ORF type:complete len:814 (+),score=271.05 c20297_g1_i1:105-2546(+)